jgi:signal recognition particle GTPase
LLSVVDRFKVPVYFIGIGETQDDINFFCPEDFVESLFD